MLSLRKNAGRERAPGDPVAADDSEVRHSQRHPLTCRSCGNEISDREALFGKDGDSPYRVFSNPYGLLREVVTVESARGLHLAGPPTTQFTWFPGYAWEVGYCDGCSAHLGWRFSAAETDADLREFFGLLRSELLGLD
jgi:cereblon